MDLIVELTRERGMSTILITHDLGLAAAYCDNIVVMERGRVVEAARASAIFRNPSHRYTRKLMRATPRPGIALRDLLPEASTAPALQAPLPHETASLLRVEGLVKEYRRQAPGGALAKFFPQRGSDTDQPFRAVDGISFEVRRGEILGLVGESGCGKSTTSMMIMRLLDPSAGTIVFAGTDIGAIPAESFARSRWRSRIQMVFQDPTDSLNPRYTAARAIADPLMRLAGAKGMGDCRARVEELAALVDLPLNLLDRFPHQLSGGQKARVGIARAIALRPDLVVLDEPTAALDVSVQAVVLNLLQDLKASLGMSYLFVSHDLHVVGLLCDRVIVMRQGRIVEEGSAKAVIGEPKADYTRELIAAIPHPPV
jgi:peptide/nickel transport system ATP-binding protein